MSLIDLTKKQKIDLIKRQEISKAMSSKNHFSLTKINKFLDSILGGSYSCALAQEIFELILNDPMALEELSEKDAYWKMYKEEQEKKCTQTHK